MTLSRTPRAYTGRHRKTGASTSTSAARTTSSPLPAPSLASSFTSLRAGLALPRSVVALAGLGVTTAALAGGASAASATDSARLAHRTPVLAYDSRGDAVRDLQLRLNVSPASGWFGPRTLAAVRAFQAREGLTGSGVVDKLTWRALPKAKRASRSEARDEAHASTGVEGLNWAALARCEAGGNPKAYNPAGYYGLYQFNLGTWRGVGGEGLPTQASAEEQTYRAQILYTRRGASPWPNCGRLLYS